MGGAEVRVGGYRYGSGWPGDKGMVVGGWADGGCARVFRTYPCAHHGRPGGWDGRFERARPPPPPPPSQPLSFICAATSLCLGRLRDSNKSFALGRSDIAVSAISAAIVAAAAAAACRGRGRHSHHSNDITKTLSDRTQRTNAQTFIR